MIKKISAAAAIVLLSATALTGCSSKLSAADTCTYINDEAKKADLQTKLTEATQSIATGNFEKMAEPMGEFTKILNDAAGKTEDTKLADALKATATQTDEMMKVVSDKNLDIMAMGEKINELEKSGNLEEQTKYLSETCPNMDALDSSL